MLDISLGDGGTVCCPLEPANAFPPAPTEHIPATPCASRVSRSQLHLTCTHSAVGLVSCVFSCLLSHLCFLSASRPSHDRVSGACAAAVADFSVAAVNFFVRLRRACHWLLLSPAAGLGARLLGSFFWAASFYCTIAADQRSQAHGKGMAPEAGPRHGAAGLWVTPECAARATGHCRRRRHHRRRRRHRPSRPTHRLRPCRRSKAAPLAALATQAALRPRSMEHGWAADRAGSSARCGAVVSALKI
jgi:hypothetical protein